MQMKQALMRGMIKLQRKGIGQNDNIIIVEWSKYDKKDNDGYLFR